MGMILRTLRALHDLRRHAPPVVIQNAGQMNLGGWQVNLMGAGLAADGVWRAKQSSLDKARFGGCFDFD